VRNVTLVQVKINGTEYFRKTLSATGPLDVNVLYLGGMPQMGRTVRQVEAIPDRSEITKSPVNFKGIIQDVQVTFRILIPQQIYVYVFHMDFSLVDFPTKILYVVLNMSCPSNLFLFNYCNNIK